MDIATIAGNMDNLFSSPYSSYAIRFVILCACGYLLTSLVESAFSIVLKIICLIIIISFIPDIDKAVANVVSYLVPLLDKDSVINSIILSLKAVLNL